MLCELSVVENGLRKWVCVSRRRQGDGATPSLGVLEVGGGGSASSRLFTHAAKPFFRWRISENYFLLKITVNPSVDAGSLTSQFWDMRWSEYGRDLRW
ncbi:hypothetical protein ACFX2H_012629 [Malus domestica]